MTTDRKPPTEKGGVRKVQTGKPLDRKTLAARSAIRGDVPKHPIREGRALARGGGQATYEKGNFARGELKNHRSHNKLRIRD